MRNKNKTNSILHCLKSSEKYPVCVKTILEKSKKGKKQGLMKYPKKNG